MFMEKIFKSRKLHSNTEYSGYNKVSQKVSGCYSQDQLTRSMDSCETGCRFNLGYHVPMSRM